VYLEFLILACTIYILAPYVLNSRKGGSYGLYGIKEINERAEG